MRTRRALKVSPLRIAVFAAIGAAAWAVGGMMIEARQSPFVIPDTMRTDAIAVNASPPRKDDR